MSGTFGASLSSLASCAICSTSFGSATFDFDTRLHLGFYFRFALGLSVYFSASGLHRLLDKWFHNRAHVSVHQFLQSIAVRPATVTCRHHATGSKHLPPLR